VLTVDLGDVIDFYNKATADLPDHTKLKGNEASGRERRARPQGGTVCGGVRGKPAAGVGDARRHPGRRNVNQDSPISDSLHPLINMAIIGLVLMFVAAVWIFFDSDPPTGHGWMS